MDGENNPTTTTNPLLYAYLVTAQEDKTAGTKTALQSKYLGSLVANIVLQ
jgi:hypothetical protein